MRIVAALAAAVIAAAPWLPPLRVGLRAGIELRAVVSGAAAVGLGGALLVGAGAPLPVAVAGAALAAPGPAAVRRTVMSRRAARTAQRWPDFLTAVRARVAAGSSLPEATRAAGAHVGGPFADFDVGFGAGFDVHLEQLRSRWADPIADRVFATLASAAATGGGHVDAVLRRLADSIAAELRLRRTHDAALTQQRLTAGVALLAPWAILALSIVTNPTAADAYSTRVGGVIVIAGLACTGTGYLLAARIARLARPPRLFG